MRSFSALIVGLSLVSATAHAQDVEDRLFDVEERLDQVEKDSLLDRLQWGGDYQTIFNSVIYDGPSPDPFDRSDPSSPTTRPIERSTPEIWSHRLRLRMTAEPVDSVRVTARLVMYKIFGDSDAPPFIQDFAATRVPRDSGIRLDQAWIDWFMFDWMALSAGRIAYQEGNPAELRWNSTTRRATWGLHMVDGEYETINLTFTLAKDLGWYFRLFYASWFFDNDSDPFGGFGFLDSGNDNLRIIGGNTELSIPGLGKNFVQLGYYIVPDFRPFTLPIPDPGYDPEDDYRNAPPPLGDAYLFPSSKPDSMGSYQNASALIELYDVLGAGLDLFVSGSVGYLNPNGQGIAYEVPSDPSDPSSPRREFPFLFLASQGDEGLTGFVYTGMRYTFPLEDLNEPKLGFEFNWGSRYHISFNQQTVQLINKLATRGKAYEAYVILPFNDSLFLRGSYVFIDTDYSGSFFGPNPAAFGTTAPEVDRQLHSFNAVLNATF